MATLPLSVATDAGPVSIGVDRRGDHHLLLPVSDRRAVSEDARSAHVRVVARDLVVEGKRRAYIDLVCHRPDLAGLFDDILVSVLEGVEATPANAVDVVRHTLDEWRELLLSRGGLLDEGPLRGLFGELVVLDILTRAGLSGPIERIWTGPDRTPHDFARGGGHLEVKTLGASGTIVEIHGLDQLAPSSTGALDLVVVRLQEDNGGRNLPEIVSSLERLVNDRRGLLMQLAKAGYAHGDADHYRDRRYVIYGLAAFRVGPGFPRIVRESFVDDVPVEIVEVRYALDLIDRLPAAAIGAAAEEVIVRGGPE